MVPGAVLERHQCYLQKESPTSCNIQLIPAVNTAILKQTVTFQTWCFCASEEQWSYGLFNKAVSISDCDIIMCASQYIPKEGHNCFIFVMNITELSKQYHPMNKNIYDVSVCHIGENVCKYFLQHTCHCICI